MSNKKSKIIEGAIDPLFTGLTRPSMIWGISYEAFVISIMFSAILFLGVGNPFYLLVYVPLHLVCYGICIRDPRAFRLIVLWLNTKGRSNTRNFWGASSSSPFFNTRRLQNKR